MSPWKTIAVKIEIVRENRNGRIFMGDKFSCK